MKEPVPIPCVLLACTTEPMPSAPAPRELYVGEGSTGVTLAPDPFQPKASYTLTCNSSDFPPIPIEKIQRGRKTNSVPFYRDLIARRRGRKKR